MSIRLEGVRFAYGDFEVLRDISLIVPQGARIGIIGASGGGKSTLLKLLSGLYEAQTGEVEVAGERVPARIRARVAMVMQSPMLLPASIRENITCGHDMPEAHVLRVVRAAQLTDWVATLPEGLDAFVGERGGKVSGGQAQRIAIARAMAKDAPVVLLDEATSALDTDTRGAVLDALGQLTRGRTVVSVSHQRGALADCDAVYKLEGGRLSDA